jgi:hypothetical protein
MVREIGFSEEIERVHQAVTTSGIDDASKYVSKELANELVVFGSPSVVASRLGTSSISE